MRKIKAALAGLLVISLAGLATYSMDNEIKQGAAHFLDEHAEEFASISDTIWSYAELGFQEFKSSEALAKILKKYGFDVKLGVAGMPTAIVASWGSGHPAIGFLGEYDALHELSQKSLGHKEPVLEGAPGHGCGHNILGVTGVLGAIALKNVMEKHGLKGTVKFFGCPAEEAGSGKIFMVADGLFDGIDAVLDNHPGSSLSTSYGTRSSALISVKVTYSGKTSHAGGAPWLGVSALDAANIMGTAVEYLREHIHYSARIHYVILEGGGWANVVPDKVVVQAMVRGSDDRLLDTYQKFLNCVKAGAIATGCTYKVEILEASHQTHSNEALARLLYENMKTVGLPEWTNEEQQFAKEIQKNVGSDPTGLPDEIKLTPPPAVFTGGGSSDTGDVSVVAPFVSLTTPCNVKGIGGHNWGIVATGGTGIAHKGLIAGAKILAFTGVDVLTMPEELKKIRAEFGRMILRYPYVSYVPEDFKPVLDMFKEEMDRWRPLMEPYYLEQR